MESRHGAVLGVCAPPGAAIWCNKLLQKSALKAPSGHIFVKVKKEGGDPEKPMFEIFLLPEYQAHFRPLYISWGGSATSAALPKGSKLLAFITPRADSKYFWQLVDFQDAADFSARTSRGSQWIKSSMKSWNAGMERCGVLSCNIIRPFLRGIACADLQAQTWAASTPALIYLLSHWASTMHAEQDRKKAMSLLDGLFRNYLEDCIVVVLHFGGLCDPEHLPTDGDLLTFSRGAFTWAGPHMGMTPALRGESHCLVELVVASQKIRCKALLSHLVFGIAKHIEAALEGSNLSTNPLEALSAAPARYHRRADRERRQALQDVTGNGSSRNGYRTDKTGKALGLNVLAHKALADAAAQKKYMLASRRLFAGGISFACIPDKSRFSGQDWLGNSVYCAEVDTIAWCAPQAISRASVHIGFWKARPF